jgi:hypothetical protein
MLVGVVVRFWGLDTFSFAADEYFLSQSVENILRFGVPAFECGGYYMRGLLHQYFAAGIQLTGFTPEFAIRAVSALSSVFALPAAYLLGCRTYGRTAGALLVTLMAISLWEVEMARFGRMYAPFQAVFLWYMLFFLRYVVDRHRASAWGMAILTVVGAFVWEGGVFLALANFIPVFLNHTNGRWSQDQWRYVGAMFALFVPVYWFVTHDFRFQGDISALPPDYDELVAAAEAVDDPADEPMFATLPSHPIWLFVALLPLLFALRAALWPISIRERWLAASGLVVVLVAALLHQFLIVTLVLLLLLLCRLLRIDELIERPVFILAIIAAGLYWSVFGLSTVDWRSGELAGGADVVFGLVYQMFGYPEFLDLIARQSARVMPKMALSLFLLVGIATFIQIYTDRRETIVTQPQVTNERALLVAAILMLLLVSISDPPRTATRYFFFVYPLLLVVAIGVIHGVIKFIKRRDDNISEYVTIAVVLVWVASTEDFNFYHLRNISTPEVNFRHHLPYKVRAHYIRRTDLQGVADWLSANANPKTDLIISGNGVNALDAYYSDLNFVYVDPGDSRLNDWSCNGGTTDRWSNLPLVYSLELLRSRISARPRSYMVIDDRRFEKVSADLANLGARLAWENPYGFEAIIEFQPGKIAQANSTVE